MQITEWMIAGGWTEVEKREVDKWEKVHTTGELSTLSICLMSWIDLWVWPTFWPLYLCLIPLLTVRCIIVPCLIYWAENTFTLIWPFSHKQMKKGEIGKCKTQSVQIAILSVNHMSISVWSPPGDKANKQVSQTPVSLSSTWLNRWRPQQWLASYLYGPHKSTGWLTLSFSPSRCGSLSYITDRYKMYRTHKNVCAQWFELLHTYESYVIFVKESLEQLPRSDIKPFCTPSTQKRKSSQEAEVCCWQ